MKHLIFILLMAVIFSGCKKDPGIFEFDEEMTLKTGLIYHSSCDDLSVKVLNINDSRCPIGVMCVWMGEAIVNFEVTEKQTYQLILNTLDHRSDTVNDYIFRLIDVLPYPKYQVEVPDSEKKVILQINRL